MFNHMFQNKNNNQEIWTVVLRLAAFSIVIFLWGLSVKWSASGLQARNPDDPNTELIGYGLALFITVAQLIFNRGAINPTLFVVGLFAYAYGVGTNIVGINTTFQFDLTMVAFQTNPFGWVIDLMILSGLAFIIELAPEAYILWAVNPQFQTPGDAISTLMRRNEIMNVQDKRPKQNVPSYPAYSKRPENVSNSVQEQKRLELPKNEIVQYIVQYYLEHNKRTPSYAVVVKNTSLSSKSQVGKYMNQAQAFIKANNL